MLRSGDFEEGRQCGNSEPGASPVEADSPETFSGGKGRRLVCGGGSISGGAGEFYGTGTGVVQVGWESRHFETMRAETMRTVIGWLVRGYQWFVSPLLHAIAGPGAGCRFSPSCSEYVLRAVQTHGVRCGGSLGLKRLCRCHPWSGSGGEDPVPPPIKVSNENYG